MLIGTFDKEIEDELALAVSKYLESIGEDIKTKSKDGEPNIKAELDAKKGSVESNKVKSY